MSPPNLEVVQDHAQQRNNDQIVREFTDIGVGGSTGATAARVFDGKTAAPAVTDDISKGFRVGDIWIDETNDISYQCLDSTTGAAVWSIITGPGAAILG